MKAMILAAGEGKRMRPLTLNTPKPLLTICGKPLIVHHIERIKRAGIRDIVINVSYLGEQVIASLGDGSQWDVSITYSAEKSPLETAGGIWQAREHLGSEPFLLINGDVWTEYPLSKIAKITPPTLGHLVLVNNPDHNPDGDFALHDFTRHDGSVQHQGDSGIGKVAERTENTKGWTFSGVSVLTVGLLEHYRESTGDYRECFPLVAPLKWAAKQGRLSGEVFSGPWIDVGTPERLKQLDAFITNR